MPLNVHNAADQVKLITPTAPASLEIEWHLALHKEALLFGIIINAANDTCNDICFSVTILCRSVRIAGGNAPVM